MAASEAIKPQIVAANRTTVVNCPNCSLTNPGAAQRCDCGFDLSLNQSGNRLPVERVPLCGVRGWLLLFCIGTVIVGPIILLAGGATATLENPGAWAAGFLVVASGVAAGVSVWTRRRNALRFVKVYLVFLFGLGILGLIGSVAGGGPATSSAGGLVGAVIWASYFRKSKRVKATLGANL